MTETEKRGILVSAGFVWIYLTARPGVLIGAIDAYLLAPLQMVIDTLAGKRSLKRTNFLVGDKLGEGSFGVVYSGVVVPKNVTVEERTRKKGNRRALMKDSRFKDKVILKKVCYVFSFWTIMYVLTTYSFMYIVVNFNPYWTFKPPC